MKITDRMSKIILAIVIVVSLTVSSVYMLSKQGFHEDELLTYNLANSSKQLNVDGGWNTPNDFNEYLTVSDNDRFNYAQVYKNQIIDASHPPFYYALVHTASSFLPNVFSKWIAFGINVFAVTGVLIFLFLIGKKVTNNNFYALIGVSAYALSIACITTTIYLRMYATLTFFVVAFLYQVILMYQKKNTVNLRDCLLMFLTVMLGILTQYYFIMYLALVSLVFMVFKIKEKCGKDLAKYIVTIALGGIAALCIYPFIISNVLGGNRGFGSLSISIDAITVVTYVFYKLATYIQVLSKDLFINQVWLFVLCAFVAVGFWFFFRFIKKQKLSREAVFLTFPTIAYFLIISLLSPFNSDRYVMISLPLIAMLFAFAFIKIVSLIKLKRINYVLPIGVILVSAIAFATVSPYYIYGKTNLYEPKTKNCLFVGTAMLEWNKCIDKLMNYDNTMIVQTDNFSSTLSSELEEFANKRGVITNGKINEFVNGYMNNGGENKKTDSMNVLKDDKKLNSLEEITVYISRIADKDSTINSILENTNFNNYELIQEDYSFEQFFNWYDYFVETESYCNVYRFYR